MKIKSSCVGAAWKPISCKDLALGCPIASGSTSSHCPGLPLQLWSAWVMFSAPISIHTQACDPSLGCEAGHSHSHAGLCDRVGLSQPARAGEAAPHFSFNLFVCLFKICIEYFFFLVQNLFFTIFILYWGIVDLQCCVSFRCTAE